MPIDTAIIRDIVFESIDELNLSLPEPKRISKSLDTALMGQASTLDSLGLVSLVVISEQRLSERLGVNFTLANDKAMSQRSSPFRTVATLVEYAALQLSSNSPTAQ